jgi:lactate dehydrogenase-like 2-hydroxyacid dehydrogenase
MPAMNDLPRVPVLGVAKLSPLFAALIRERHELLDRLHETDPAAFEAAAPRIRAVAAGGDSRVDAGLIARLPALQIISVMGVGYDGIDVEAARARGVVVTHTPNVLNDEVADLAIGLMLAAARQLPAADRYVRSGHWEGRGPMPLARKMSGSRLGIVGMGRIGQAIAHRAQAFGMPIAYTARSAKPGLPYRFVASVEELAAGSDFLVLITPGGEGTRHLVDAKVLRALGPKGILVNVARGSVVDEAALVDALEQGVLGGAALDVFEDEPRVPARLLALPHVVVAPHIGSATHSTRQAMADLAFANLQARLAGQPLLTPVPECA